MTASPHRPLGNQPQDANPDLGHAIRLGAVWSAGGAMFMRLTNVLVMAGLARILSKDDFGVFALALAVHLVITALAEMGLAAAIARSPREPNDIAPTVMTLSIVSTGLMAVAMAALAPQLGAVLGSPAAAQPLRILAVCLVMTGIFAVPGAQLSREFRQGRIFGAGVAGYIPANALLVILALQGHGADAFAWSRVVGQAITGLALVISVRNRYRPGFDRTVARSLIEFGMPLALANLVNWALLNADYVLIGRKLGAASVGVYMIAFSVAGWATALLTSVLNGLIVPAFGRTAEDPVGLRRALRSGARLVAFIALPISAVAASAPDALVRSVFGEKWGEAAGVLQGLAFYGALYAFSLFFSNVLVAIGQTRTLLWIQLVWIIALVPAILTGIHVAGIVGVAYAHVATMALVVLPAYLVALRRATGAGPREVLGSVGRPLLAALLAGGAVWVSGRPIAGQNSWTQLVLGACAAGVVYLLMTLPIVVALLPGRLRRSLPIGLGQSQGRAI